VEHPYNTNTSSASSGASMLSSSTKKMLLMMMTKFSHKQFSKISKHRKRVSTSRSTSAKNANEMNKASIEDENYGHCSVLLKEVIDAFKTVKIKTHVDGTLGAGGHAEEVLKAHKGECELFIGFDVDESAIEIARQRVYSAMKMSDSDNDASKAVFVQGNFDRMLESLVKVEAYDEARGKGVDSILLDLGVSSMHLDRAERGFSFQNDGPLDMRMSCNSTTTTTTTTATTTNIESGSSSSSSGDSYIISDSTNTLTAFDIVNGWSEEDLGRIFRDYGGERHWKLLAKRVCERRVEKPIETTLELVKALGNPPGKREKIHPATRAFQAIRIATNDELGVIERVIPQAIKCLNPGGRLAIITFHSLEDGIVKRLFRKFAGVAESQEPISGRSAMMANFAFPIKGDDGDDGDSNKLPKIVKLINRKPIAASDDEVKTNARSRSAKLRVCEKL
jgi:16S rRNA (cytosine1402-N4)-methyltransferase